jgi:hypothetical protein
MTRKLLAVSLVVLAAAPAAAFAGNSTRDVRVSASKQCATVQTKLGAVRFGQAFASFGACVSALAPLARQSATSAVTTCRSERGSASFAATHGGKTFARFYGVGRKGKHAFDRCVAAKERSAWVAVASAASACQSERANAAFAASHGGATFAQYYGANPFGACVTQKARPPFTVTPLQPTPAATPAQDLKTPPGGANCGPVESGGPPHPLIAGCMVVR